MPSRTSAIAVPPLAAKEEPSLAARHRVAEPLPASPMPPAPSADIAADINDTEIVMQFG